MSNKEGLIIPYSSLPEDILRAIIEEYVTREGTDYGEEYSLEDKIQEVLAQIQKGKIQITFDEESETCSLNSRH